MWAINEAQAHAPDSTRVHMIEQPVPEAHRHHHTNHSGASQTTTNNKTSMDTVQHSDKITFPNLKAS